MHFFTFAEKDATLYEGSTTQSRNTGLDEILEVRKDTNIDASVINTSRVVIKFAITNISESIVAGTIPENARYYLNLYDAKSTELTTSQSLYAYPVSQSWIQGDGRFFDKPATTEGVSWRYRDGENTGTQWVSGSNDIGGTWFSGSGYVGSQSFNHETIDMRMDVTDITKKWISGSIANEGFIVKRSGSYGNGDSATDEGSTDRLGNFAFFSRDTHTIYPPKLEVEYDDSTFNTGSLSTLDADDVDDVVVYMKGIRQEYKEKSKIKFRVYGRERFPTRTYSTSSQNLNVKFIPSQSQYSVRDALSEDEIIPFSTGSYLSCDGAGNYFRLDLNAFQPERHYRFLYKVVSGSGNTRVEHILDEDHIFKVTR